MIQVQLDPLVSKSVPVTVDTGEVPAGLHPQPATLSATTVTVSGPDSVVRLATAAVARVVIQPAGLDIDQQVPLVAVDALNNVLSPVEIDPDTSGSRSGSAPSRPGPCPSFPT